MYGTSTHENGDVNITDLRTILKDRERNYIEALKILSTVTSITSDVHIRCVVDATMLPRKPQTPVVPELTI